MNKATLIVGLVAAVIGGGVVARLASKGSRGVAIAVIALCVSAALVAYIAK